MARAKEVGQYRGDDHSADCRRRPESLKEWAVRVMADITADTSRDWTVKNVAAEVKKRGLPVPPCLYDRAQEKALTECFSTNGRKATRAVGRDGKIVHVRVFGVYYSFEQKDGREVRHPCWRDWNLMNRWHRISAVRELGKKAADARREFENVLWYVNKKEAEAGRPPVLVEHVVDVSGE